MEDIILLLESEDDIELNLESDVELIIEMNDSASHDYEEYDGAYVVVPILYDDQVLETERKVMRQDMTVKPIPIVETSNLFGGKTVVIG